MIAEITVKSDCTIIKPLFNSADPDDLWLSMYDCGFKNMYIVCSGGMYNALKLMHKAPEIFPNGGI